jgi:hypothetical protein
LRVVVPEPSPADYLIPYVIRIWHSFSTKKDARLRKRRTSMMDVTVGYSVSHELCCHSTMNSFPCQDF